jgi:hypothetical protein
MCLTSRSLGSRLVPHLLHDHPSSTTIQDYVFARFKTSISNWSWNQLELEPIGVGTISTSPKRRGTNLETKLLEVQHMSRPKILLKIIILIYNHTQSKLIDTCSTRLKLLKHTHTHKHVPLGLIGPSRQQKEYHFGSCSHIPNTLA